jgi:hypothetical protein
MNLSRYRRGLSRHLPASETNVSLENIDLVRERRDLAWWCARWRRNPAQLRL